MCTQARLDLLHLPNSPNPTRGTKTCACTVDDAAAAAKAVVSVRPGTDSEEGDSSSRRQSLMAKAGSDRGKAGGDHDPKRWKPCTCSVCTQRFNDTIQLQCVTKSVISDNAGVKPEPCQQSHPIVDSHPRPVSTASLSSVEWVTSERERLTEAWSAEMRNKAVKMPMGASRLSSVVQISLTPDPAKITSFYWDRSIHTPRWVEMMH